MSSPSKICQLAATIGIIFVLSLLTHLLCPVPVGYCISAQSPLTHDLYLVFVKQQTSVLFLYSPCWLMTFIKYFVNKTLTLHLSYPYWLKTDTITDNVCPPPDIKNVSVHFLFTCGINVYSLNIYQLPNIGVTIFSPKWPTFCSLYWQTLELFY